VKISGSRFYVLRAAGARLQRALIAWMLDVHTREHGYSEIYPPAMVKRECLVGTGNLPKFGDNLYRDAEDDLWFVPTAEVPVTNLYRDEMLEGTALPIRHVAYTPCFRREKMSAGRDVRGIKRGHQFDKVEMVKFVRPETSDDELRSLLDDAEDVCRRLGLAHRVVQMCTGDLSFTAAMKFDVEVWAPGCGEWLEVSSCSNFRDFQARRANIRYRPAAGARPELVHTRPHRRPRDLPARRRQRHDPRRAPAVHRDGRDRRRAPYMRSMNRGARVRSIFSAATTS
jgi:seryl-tRNA synthetase